MPHLQHHFLQRPAGRAPHQQQPLARPPPLLPLLLLPPPPLLLLWRLPAAAFSLPSWLPSLHL
jgi:hypothetical protein